MKFEKRYKVGKVCSKDPTRAHLVAPWLDVEAKRVIATNGYALAEVPVETAEGEAAGYLPLPALACEESKVEAAVVDCGDVIYRRPQAGLKHPGATAEQRNAIGMRRRRGDAGTITFGVSAEKLRDLADALGLTKERNVAITLDLGGALNAILVEPLVADPGARGVLMPCRVDGSAPWPTPPTPPAPKKVRR